MGHFPFQIFYLRNVEWMQSYNHWNIHVEGIRSHSQPEGKKTNSISFRNVLTSIHSDTIYIFFVCCLMFVLAEFFLKRLAQWCAFFALLFIHTYSERTGATCNPFISIFCYCLFTDGSHKCTRARLIRYKIYRSFFQVCLFVCFLRPFVVHGLIEGQNSKWSII